MPNKSWFLVENQIVELSNVQSHSALKLFYDLYDTDKPLKDREIFIPNLLEKRKEIKEYLTFNEKKFLLERLRNFNKFTLNNLAFVYNQGSRFLDIFYNIKSYPQKTYYYKKFHLDYSTENVIYYHWLSGELPIIPSFKDIQKLFALTNLFNFSISDYKKFCQLLKESINVFKNEIAPKLNEKRVKEVLQVLQ